MHKYVENTYNEYLSVSWSARDISVCRFVLIREDKQMYFKNVQGKHTSVRCYKIYVI